jgi:DNA-binding MarR family transcriptional regulator
VLSLSDKGRKVYQKVVPLALSYEAMLLSGLSAEEQDFLGNILDKLDDIQLHTL